MLSAIQKWIIGAGVLSLAALSIYVPWVHTANATAPDGFSSEKPAGYHFVFNPPEPKGKHNAFGVKVDAPRVVIPMAAVVVAMIGGVVLAARRNPPT